MICPQFEITYNYALDSLNNMNINAYKLWKMKPYGLNKYKPYVFKFLKNYPI